MMKRCIVWAVPAELAFCLCWYDQGIFHVFEWKQLTAAMQRKLLLRYTSCKHHKTFERLFF